MIKQHCELLKSHLDAGQQWSRILFPLLCTERLRTCCWAFGKEFSLDVSGVEFGCDRVFQFIQTGHLSDELDSFIGDFANMIHSSDEIGTALAVQAQYGMMALANTLELCKKDDVELATSSGIYVVDAIDNFELFAWKSVPESGEFEETPNYWLLVTELARQVRQAIQVAELNKSELVPLRIENRQYAIPAAVL